MPEINKVRHVLTFTSEEFPDKAHEVYGVLGDKNVKAKIAELEAAMKEAGYPHTVNASFPKTIDPSNRKPRQPRAPAVAPAPEPAAEPAAHKPRAAA